MSGDCYLVCEAFIGALTIVQAKPGVWFSLTGSSFVIDGGTTRRFPHIRLSRRRSRTKLPDPVRSRKANVRRQRRDAEAVA